MASQAIKEYDDFAGTNGYLIVDGLDNQTPGGKLKVPNYSGVTDGYVLTKTTTNGSDDVVWSAPGGGGVPAPTNTDFEYTMDSSGTIVTYEDDHIFYSARKIDGQIKYGWMTAKELGGEFDTSIMKD